MTNDFKPFNRAVVFATGAQRTLSGICAGSWAFLVLSGLATGASWLCYYYAVQQGQVSIVVPIDKLSTPLTVLFSAAVFKEHISAKSWCGLALLTAGILALAAMA